jgi:hypothetical protein
MCSIFVDHFVLSHLAVLAVHVGVADPELLPGLAHPEALPESHEDGAHTWGATT